MSNNDDLTCIYIDADTARLMRDAGKPAPVGWGIVDDDNRVIDGGYPSCEACETALARLRA